MQNNIKPQRYSTTYQLKLPLEISTIIEVSDPVYTFCEVMDHIDLRKYLVTEENKTGRKRYDSEILLKVILFAFMERGYASVREIEKLCKTDIRFMWLLQENKAPSFMTIDNFMNNCLLDNIDNIFAEINQYIFLNENADINHVYIDGTKIVANANKYSWVWKKSCIKNRQKVFEKVSDLLNEINKSIVYQNIKFEIRSEYAIEYLEEITAKYIKIANIDINNTVKGRGHCKTAEQRTYEKLVGYAERLKKYVNYSQVSRHKKT